MDFCWTGRTRLAIWMAMRTSFIALLGIASQPSLAQPVQSATSQPTTPAYELAFSTYFGSAADCRGIYVDGPGNVYVGGTTWWQDKLKAQGLKDGWVTTEGAFDRTTTAMPTWRHRNGAQTANWSGPP